MLSLAAIALNTMREAFAERLVTVLLFLAGLAVLGGWILGRLSIAQTVRIPVDLGLFTIGTVGGIIAIFLGTSLFHREIDQGTIDLIFTKPLPRWHLIAGKFLGLAACLALATSLMGVFLCLVVHFLLPDQIAAHLLFKAVFYSLVLIYVEELLVLALALFFSTFNSPLSSVLFALCFWAIAHCSSAMLGLSQMSNSSAATAITQAVYLVLPDLSAFSRAQEELMRAYELARHAQLEGVVLSLPPSTGPALPMVLTYIFGYILLLLSAGTYIVERREFN
ncbi:MAG: ABC transporter permease [Candidatus Obscuribacterales bacterium]